MWAFCRQQRGIQVICSLDDDSENKNIKQGQNVSCDDIYKGRIEKYKAQTVEKGCEGNWINVCSVGL